MKTTGSSSLKLFEIICLESHAYTEYCCTGGYNYNLQSSIINQYIYIKEDADVSRIVWFSLLIFLKFRIETIIIIQKIRFKNSKSNTILFKNSEDNIILLLLDRKYNYILKIRFRDSKANTILFLLDSREYLKIKFLNFKIENKIKNCSNIVKAEISTFKKRMKYVFVFTSSKNNCNAKETTVFYEHSSSGFKFNPRKDFTIHGIHSMNNTCKQKPQDFFVWINLQAYFRENAVWTLR